MFNRRRTKLVNAQDSTPKIKRRPITGSCPECKAKQEQYCKDTCTLLDVCNMARE